MTVAIDDRRRRLGSEDSANIRNRPPAAQQNPRFRNEFFPCTACEGVPTGCSTRKLAVPPLFQSFSAHPRWIILTPCVQQRNSSSVAPVHATEQGSHRRLNKDPWIILTPCVQQRNSSSVAPVHATEQGSHRTAWR